METRVPAEVFPPGEFIRDELEARGWTQEDLAHILNRPLVAVNQIINGKRSVTPETAKSLAAALGTSAEFWLNLESAYQLSQVNSESEEVSLRAKLYSVAPVTEMVRRGWIEGSRRVDDLAIQLQRFFETDDLDKIQTDVAARKSTSYDELTSPQRAWCAQARRLARTISASRFDEKRFSETIPLLRAMTPSPENLGRLPAILADVGVRLVLIAHLEKTRIDGAAFWLDRRDPVVALSLRFDRLDNFWHTLTHELIHIKHRDADVIDSDVQGSDESDESNQDKIETRTNAEAAASLVPKDKLESFIIRVRPLYSRVRIIQFAQANGVHPAIVVGQLHHRREIPPKNLRDLLVPIRHLIVGKAMTDGWGHKSGPV